MTHYIAVPSVARNLRLAHALSPYHARVCAPALSFQRPAT